MQQVVREVMLGALPHAMHATHATLLTHVSKTDKKSLVLKRAREMAVDNRRSAT